MEKLNKLACEIVENLVDCDGAEPEVVEQYQKWTLKRMDEAFRALEKRAEAAEDRVLVLADDLTVERESHNETLQREDLIKSKLSELEQQEPVAYWHRSGQVVTRGESHNDKIFAICCKVERPLFTRPAPAADLAGMVPGDDLLRVLSFAKFVIKCVRKNGEYSPLSSQEPDEIAAILRNIEDAGKKHE